MDYTNIKHGNKTLKLPIASDSSFQWILSLIRSDVVSILKSFTIDNHFLLILMKPKLGVSNRDLSLRFNIKVDMCPKLSEYGYQSWSMFLLT